MRGWRTYRIADLGRIVTGKTPPSSQPELFEGTIPFITPSDMAFDCRNVITQRFVSPSWDKKQRTMLPEGAICVVCIGATIGKICMSSTQSQTNQQINSVIVNDKFDGRFVYYILRTKTDELVAKSAGAATPIINKSMFSEIEIMAPCVDDQRRISSIICKYDDLIEINKRRIFILEEMARGIFDEWFVRFRFPGHESVPVLETPHGPLPKGWGWGVVSDVASSGARLINPSAFPNEVFAHHSIPAFDEGRSPIMDAGVNIKSNKIEFDSPVVLFSKLNPRINRIWCVSDKMYNRKIASTEFVPLFPNGNFLNWLYCLVGSYEFTEIITAMAVGTSTSHQRVRPKDILNVSISIPSMEIIENAERILSSIFEMVRNVIKSNIILAASRDLLLPRLVSGQLSVVDAEQESEEAV